VNVLVEAEERQTAFIPAEVVEVVPREFWRSADCRVTRSPGDPDWTLTAGDSVGVSRISTPAGEVTLSIRAKLPNADVFFMADYAFGQRHEPLRLLDFDDPVLDSVRSDPTACLLMWHARTVNQFASRWLRRDYRSQAQVLEGKARGKILVGQYVKNHLAVGEASSIPCRVLERTQDTPNNRLLKAGLRYIATLSHALPVPAARYAVLRQVNAALPKFAQVADIHPTPADLRTISTRGPQRHYAPVLRATMNLLAHRFINDQPGEHATQSFMWQMPVLFQESVRGIISAIDGATLDTSVPLRATIYSGEGHKHSSSRVDPDLVIRSFTGRTVLLDTKYKHALPIAAPNTGSDEIISLPDNQRVKVGRSDIYQAVAYGQHDSCKDAATGLLYPVSLPSNHPLPKPMEVRGFGGPVHLLFIDIGPGARSNLKAFYSEVRKLITSGEPA
jgi:5-methylcytosine-specific restriction enzyme subunit McrC